LFCLAHFEKGDLFIGFRKHILAYKNFIFCKHHETILHILQKIKRMIQMLFQLFQFFCV